MLVLFEFWVFACAAAKGSVAFFLLSKTLVASVSYFRLLDCCPKRLFFQFLAPPSSIHVILSSRRLCSLSPLVFSLRDRRVSPALCFVILAQMDLAERVVSLARGRYDDATALVVVFE